MKILVIYDSATKEIRRLAGPLPVNVDAHVQPGESYLVADTTEPKSVAELQAMVEAVQ